MSQVHRCNLHCHSMDPETLEMMGIEQDRGKWLPFAFDLNIVVACKLTSDEEDQPTYNCSTIFTEFGDTYIIDTPYTLFQDIFASFYNGSTDVPGKSNELNF